MRKWLKNKESVRLEAAERERAKQEAIIAEIEEKSRKRQAIINARDQKYNIELSHYQYRCETFLANMPAFDRLVWFIGQYGIHRRKYQPVEWSAIVRDAGLDSVMKMVNDVGGMGEIPPKKIEVNPLVEGD